MNEILSTFSKDVLKNFELKLEDYIANLNVEAKLKEAIAYSLLDGGKRVRPLLVFLIIDMFGEEYKKGLEAAMAVEFIHTYSLIHDDLPAMDNDDYRRGKLTNHKVFGDALAILAADALNTDAFSVLAESSYDSDIKVKLVAKLAKCAGSYGMVAGQVFDIFSSEEKYQIEKLEYLHSLKTGKLIEYSIIAPLYVLGKDEHVNIFSKIAQNIGLIFQIKDDILDVTSTSEVLGKTIGKDELLNKSTYVTILGLEGAVSALEGLFQETLTLVKELNLNSDRFVAFIEYLVNRQK